MRFFRNLTIAFLKWLHKWRGLIANEKYFANKTGKGAVFTFFFVSLHYNYSANTTHCNGKT